MGSSVVQIVCVVFGVLGFVGIIFCCAIPRWRVSYHIGANIATAQTIQEGLWMTCVVPSTRQRQCKYYDSPLALSSDLQAARALTIISCILSGLSLLILFCCADFTICVQYEDPKPKIILVAAVGLLLAGLLAIIQVSWSAHFIVGDSNITLLSAPKREVGICIYVGMTAGVLLLLGGGLLCCFRKRDMCATSVQII